jgi:drug/metabolite transporter (DMT)-like permease
MNLSDVVGGVVVILCGVVLVLYTGLINEQPQPDATYFWVISAILVFVGAYISGKELRKKSK